MLVTTLIFLNVVFFFKLSYSSIRIGVQTALQNVLEDFLPNTFLNAYKLKKLGLYTFPLSLALNCLSNRISMCKHK